jgi:hypothetical protein
MTLRETFIDRCIKAGFTLVDGRSKKYLKYRHPRVEYYVLIGKCGSFRWSRTGNVARSYAFNDRTRDIILADAERGSTFLSTIPYYMSLTPSDLSKG